MAKTPPYMVLTIAAMAAGSSRRFDQIGEARAIFLSSLMVANGLTIRFGQTGADFPLQSASGMLVKPGGPFTEFTITAPVGAGPGTIAVSSSDEFFVHGAPA